MTRILACTLLTFALTAGCGDDGGTPPDATPDAVVMPDTGVDARPPLPDAVVRPDATADAAPDATRDARPEPADGDPPVRDAMGGGSAAANAFCMGYARICMFGASGRHADRAACVAAFDGYTRERQACVTTHLDLARSGAARHCPHATGEAPCN